ncbi:MAG: InlB B-repeat-containing protein, partial [Lachnospiraceae bacterium]|nr:InlB B-repeat-containing protein [Lachnospiraceae bacterium]
MKKLIKRISAVLLSILVLLSSMSVPTISTVMADEDTSEVATEYVDESAEPEAPIEETLPVDPGYADTQDSFDIPADTEESYEDTTEAQAETTEETTEEETTENGKQELNTETLSFSGAGGGIEVRVSADPGTFPVGTIMTVVGVSSAEVYDTVNNAVKGEVAEVRTVDITFYGPDGVEVQPEIPVHMILSAPGLDASAKKEVVHIADDGQTDVITGAAISGNNATLDADSFSKYNILTLTQDSKDEASENTEDEKTRDSDNEKAGSDETWKVEFYDRDADLYQTVNVVKGKAIGDLLPETIAREDYNAYWAIGEIVQGEQGTEIRVTGDHIDADFIPSADTTIVPDYDKITYTVKFFQEDKTTEVASKTVDVDTSYCLNDIPSVPAKTGNTGKWVYEGGEFTNQVKVSADTTVWAEYTKNVFTVTYQVEGDTYETDTYYSGDSLTLPADPTVEGKDFVGWFLGETEYVGGEKVSSDITLIASFTNQFAVSFVVLNDEGTAQETLSQYFRSEGEVIGTMPQNPFVSGKVFEKWVIQGTETEVTAETEVTGNLTVVAVFRTVDVYNITAEYYYLNDAGNEVVFNTDLMQVEAHELPYTITAPSTTQTDPAEVAGAPIYYPENPTITVTENDFVDYSKTVRFKYVPFTAEYDFVYMLKDLEGDGYTEIERVKDVQGVLNSYVTPTVKTYDYAVLELAEGATITQAKGQELKVYYNRKNYSLTYETNGGTYVGGTTAAYGTQVALSTTVPTRDGYNFGGWYLDEGLTQAAGSTVEIKGNTTIYAKWSPKTVNYTIVYMFEKYDDTGTTSSYVYDNSRTGTAQVGTTVQASNAPTITRKGWEKDTAKNATSSVVIAADGSSVLRVYYKLVEYTLNFNRNNHGSIVKPDGTTTTNTYSFKAKLGQDISGLWPSARRNNYSFMGWQKNGQGTRYVTKQLIMNTDLLPTNGTSITYYASWGSAYTFTVNYYLQNADDDNYTRSEAYSQTYNADSYGITPKTISGYTFDHGNNDDYVTTYNLYYKRNTYQIDYYYGSNKLNTINNVKFDANINKSPYVWTPTAAQCGVDNDFTFEGWYSDSGLTTPYSFSTMPASNLVLYAKWTAPSYTVNFVDDDGTTVLADSKTVEKYHKVEKPNNPTKAGYTFDGWYTTVDGSTLFDWNTQITADTTVYAHWTRDTLSYTVHYVDDEGSTIATDKVVSNPNYTIGQNVTEYAIAIAGYRPDESSKTLVLQAKDNDITFVYRKKAETTKYTVRYIIADGEAGAGTKVADDKIVENVPGDTASVIELAAAVDYETLYETVPELDGIEFFPDEIEKTIVLTSDDNNNVLTFYYSSFKHANVKVHFVDMAGNPITDDDVQVLKVGKTYTLSRTPIAGWELNKAVEGKNYGGTEAGSSYKITEEVTQSGLEFTIFYQKKATITVNSLSKQYDGTALKLPSEIGGQVTVEGLLEGDSLSAVSLSYDGNDVEAGRLNAGVATVKPSAAVLKGTHANISNYYSIRYISGTLEVTKINVTVRIEPDRWTNAPYTGTPYLTGFTNPSKTVEDYIMISHDGYKSSYLNSIWDVVKTKAQEGGAGLGYYGIKETNVGDYTYDISLTSAELPKDDNYSVSLYVRQGRLQIVPKKVTITAKSQEFTYDGTSHSNDSYDVDGLVGEDAISAVVEGSITFPSESPVTNEVKSYTFTTGTADNYEVTTVNGELTMTNASVAITITAASQEWTYDGKAHSNNEVTVTSGSLLTGDTLVATATGSVTNVADTTTGNNPVAEGYKIMHGTEDVTANYKITASAGTLTIKPIAITITAASQEWTYDGSAHSNNEVTVTSGSLLTGDRLVATATGSVTNVADTAANNNPVAEGYKIMHGTEDVTANYAITTAAG